MANLPQNTEIVIKSFPLAIAPEGQVTIPKEILSNWEHSSQNSLCLLQVGELFLLLPNQIQVSSLAHDFITEMKSSKVDLENLLEGLQEERQAIWQESKEHD